MKKKHLFILLIIVFIDQISKFLIETTMTLGQKITVIPKFFNITYVHNTGAAWSILEGKMIFFYIISIVALIGMYLFYRNSSSKEPWTQYGLLLMMAGTIGNFIDRLFFQYVRDFLDFIILGYDFPIFNIADMALCIGVAFIFIDLLIENYGMVLKNDK